MWRPVGRVCCTSAPSAGRDKKNKTWIISSISSIIPFFPLTTLIFKIWTPDSEYTHPSTQNKGHSDWKPSMILPAGAPSPNPSPRDCASQAHSSGTTIQDFHPFPESHGSITVLTFGHVMSLEYPGTQVYCIGNRLRLKPS